MRERSRKRARRHHRGPPKRPRPANSPPLFAAIDLGTNNCRLLIGTRGLNGNLRVVDSFSRIVRLGEGVAQSGRLSDAAIERAVAALKVCAARLRKNDIRHVRAIATEACRRAENARALIARTAEETGIELEIVTADEEARIAAIGCAPLVDPKHEGAIVFDIGGGSTEIIWLKCRDGETEVEFAASAPIGVVTLSETPSLAGLGYGDLLARVLPFFGDIAHAMNAHAPFSPRTHHLLGTSGTVTTLAAVALGLPRYERAKVDASWHTCGSILDVISRIVSLDLYERAKLACIGEARADLVVPGCAIFSAIHANWPCTDLRVADRGLREGMLRKLMAEYGV